MQEKKRLEFIAQLSVCPAAMALILSDVDGTLAHYEAEEIGSGDVVRFPPSSTGLCGAMSRRTVQQLAALRAEGGHTLALLSGMRLSTFVERLPMLPVAEAYAVENGGRLFWLRPGCEGPLTLDSLEEDAAWRRTHDSAAGPAEGAALPASERAGDLWDAHRSLLALGVRVDARGYSTLIRLPKQPACSALDSFLSSLPPTLTICCNLGCADIFPTSSSKQSVAAHVAKRVLGVDSLADRRVLFLCDDDNDVDLAQRVGHTFVVGVNCARLEAAIAESPERFTVAKGRGVVASEESLESVAAYLRAQAPL